VVPHKSVIARVPLNVIGSNRGPSCFNKREQRTPLELNLNLGCLRVHLFQPEDLGRGRLHASINSARQRDFANAVVVHCLDFCNYLTVERQGERCLLQYCHRYLTEVLAKYWLVGTIAVGLFLTIDACVVFYEHLVFNDCNTGRRWRHPFDLDEDIVNVGRWRIKLLGI
jgi:hypothetical protein